MKLYFQIYCTCHILIWNLWCNMDSYLEIDCRINHRPSLSLQTFIYWLKYTQCIVPAIPYRSICNIKTYISKLKLHWNWTLGLLITLLVFAYRKRWKTWKREESIDILKHRALPNRIKDKHERKNRNCIEYHWFMKSKKA